MNYEDGAQLYRCTFDGPKRLASLATGLCRRTPDGDFALRLYHHTNRAAAANIRRTNELWSSQWNLAGTRNLLNVAYGYFTPLTNINNEQDLRRIAMSSDEFINFQTTSSSTREKVLSLKVYRGSTTDRVATIGFDLQCAVVAPNHLYFHPNVGTNPAYYEVVGPEIVRVGVRPSAKLLISGSNIEIEKADLKRFEYVILGDTGTLDGLAAPYNEEETKEVAILEKLNARNDFFQFWWTNQNTDQVTGRSFEHREIDSK
ncbi:MAG: hypothetical protein E5W38_01455 [Mesorhizobium sp.]|uniref:hypothetical protein n=1 Tax=unclassified Mesorhizobium TaxID=325217 RepID=UPI000F74D1B1|nr:MULTISPECIES: hypothetical protein [unclassified Mesorhizobium]AZO24392.1 hypothetical protein EJ070_29350 [Mesorhizobium sp. M1E.F.Ca.ET.045.02.1.1]RUW31354.1 hypothetical protein EOA38_18085 [Mesorhizobium sp. M1E.F.Ca.ET.041.01.1.1]RUW80856.1 hypothetical protein EOA29_21660 [Mesorhizobium sp. M1E.F.Ca.ET.063.01.1.1]RWB51999.1 MAG: hypothetical protein EOQ47_27585 [Mesorhizobium sp.]RWD82347.1 MAG: hypothetical protein EOS38_27050 [Mesorhizobium sp.]